MSGDVELVRFKKRQKYNLVSFFGRFRFLLDILLVVVLELSCGQLLLTLVDVGVVEEPGEENEVAAVHEKGELEVGVTHSALEACQK